MSVPKAVWGVGAALCVALGLEVGSLRGEPTRLTFLSVGQGDCAVVQSEGRTVLIDAAPVHGAYDAAKSVVLRRLRAMGIDRIDLILLSHPDMDHVGGTGTLLRAFPEARIGMSAGYRNDPEMRAHLRSWGLDSAAVAWLPPESGGKLGSLPLRIVCPPVHPGHSNDGSMFVRFGEGRSAVVFSGDAPSGVEDAEARNGDWHAEVLKAGHHGSKGSSDTPWLAAVHPSWVVISCGVDNVYGHPHRDALARIAASGARVARTDREGDITFELRDGRWVRTK